MRRCRTIVLFMLALVPTATAAAAAGRPYNDKPNSLHLRTGDFDLDGHSIYWRIREADFFGSVADFDDRRIGGTYTRMLTERWGALVTASRFEGQQTTSFRDFVGPLGGEILHTTTLEVSDIGVGGVFYLFRRDARVAPYVGAGLGVYSYDLREEGEFIDFDTFDLFLGSFRGTGEEVGVFWLVGVEVPITSGFSIFGEARWHDVQADLNDDFFDFGEIDLSGQEISFGAAFRF